MEVNLRYDEFFVEDLAWHEAASNYQAFLQKYQDKKIVFLELGVGMNTPVFCSSSTRKKSRKNTNKQQISTSSNLMRKYEERRCA